MSALIKDPLPGAPIPPILPPQDGYLFLDRAKFHASFAADVSADLAAFMADSQVPWGIEALDGAVSEPAWKKKPSWYLVSAEDRMIPPDAQRAMSKRAGATVVEAAILSLPLADRLSACRKSVRLTMADVGVRSGRHEPFVLERKGLGARLAPGSRSRVNAPASAAPRPRNSPRVSTHPGTTTQPTIHVRAVTREPLPSMQPQSPDRQHDDRWRHDAEWGAHPRATASRGPPCSRLAVLSRPCRSS